VLTELLAGNGVLGYRLRDFDLIHASPPCQAYVAGFRALHRDREYPDLVATVRMLLHCTGLPYVIENVPGAPLINPVTLCGGQFGLTVYWPEKGRSFALRRHRLFESNMHIADKGSHDHSLRALSVIGHGPGNDWSKANGGQAGYAGVTRKLMGIEWMTQRELTQSIPPVFTEYVGSQILGAALREAA
jgi:DNA (cytosine-5)-methyltransferase 1